jgi:trimeric autotransporter adhesin
MKKIFHISFIIAALCFAFIAVSCTLFNTEELKVQSDDGVQINSITLSESGLSMSSAYKGITTQVITASYTPVYAADTTINWTSSDASVATVTATGTSTTVTAQGTGTAIITAASQNGSVTAKCSVTCTLESTPPLEVSDATVIAYGNSAVFSWTDPADSDGDLDHILIRSYPTSDSTTVTESTFDAGTGSGRVKGLIGLTAYTFELYTVDVDGNESNAVTLTATTTESDTTAPASITDFAASSKTGNSITLSWTASSDTDVSYVEISADCSDSSAEIPDTVQITSGTTTATLSGLKGNTTYTFSAVAVDNDLNESSAVTCKETTYLLATDISASRASFTGGITVTWTDPDNSFSKLTVTATPVSGTAVSMDVAADVETATLTGLTVDTEYSVTITTTYTDGTTTNTTTDSVTVTPVEVYMKFVNGWSSTAYYLVPDITSSTTYCDVICMTASDISTNGLLYDRWIVHPSLSSPTDTSMFSLEAADSTGTGSGYYLYIDPDRAMDSSSIYYTKWSFSATSYTHHAYVAKTTDSYLSGNESYASFSYSTTTKSQTTASAWKMLTWSYDSSYSLYGVCLNILGGTSSSASSTADYAWGLVDVTE